MNSKRGTSKKETEPIGLQSYRYRNIPVFHGRWQPLHNGQMWLIKRIVEDFGMLVLGIVNPDPSNPPDPLFDRFPINLNPFTFWERSLMITESLKDEKINKNVAIVPLWHPRVPPGSKGGREEETFLPPKKWRVHIVPMLSVAEEIKATDLRKQDEEVKLIEDIPSELLKCNETIIRKLIYLNDPSWEEMVPSAVAKKIKELDGIDRIKRMYGHTRGTISAEALNYIDFRSEGEVDYPIFAGRFQPFHNGHYWVVKEILKEAGRCVLGIVNPDPEHPPDPTYPTFHRPFNPFSYWERLIMIREVLIEDGLLDNVYMVPLWHPRTGVETDKAFLPRRRHWVIPDQPSDISRVSDLLKLGEHVETIELPTDIKMIQENDIRASLSSREDWASQVPNKVAEWIRRFNGELRVRDLYVTYGLAEGRVHMRALDTKRYPLIEKRTSVVSRRTTRAVRDIVEGLMELKRKGKLAETNPCTKIEIVRKCGVSRQTLDDRIETVKEILRREYGLDLLIKSRERKKGKAIFLIESRRR